MATADERNLFVAYSSTDVQIINAFLRDSPVVRDSSTFVGADFGAWAEFAKCNITYRTPSSYFDSGLCSELDEIEPRLSQSWYLPLKERLISDGVSLGEMAEFDFVELFRGALRSIEIASSMIRIEHPDQVWLPYTVQQAADPNKVKYEPLERCLSFLAGEGRFRVRRYGEPPYTSPSSRWRKYFRRLKIGYEQRSTFKYLLHGALELARIEAIETNRARFNKARGKIVFVDVPSEICDPIQAALARENAILSIRIPSSTIANLGCFRANRGLNLRWSDIDDISLEYKGISLGRLLEEWFLDILNNRFRMLRRLSHGTKTLVHSLHPSAVVLMDDVSPPMRTIATACKMFRTPTLVIQHGAMSGGGAGFGVMPIVADKQAVWGEQCREWHLTRGMRPESQVVTGSPKFDKLIANLNSWKDSRILRELGVDETRGFVLIATDWYGATDSCHYPEDHHKFLVDTLSALKSLPSKQTVVKLPPGESPEMISVVSTVARNLGMDSVVITRSHLWNLLSACDLVITMTSTVGLEAMFFEKPVITILDSRLERYNPYRHSGAVVELIDSNSLEISSAIRRCLTDENLRRELSVSRRRFLHEYANFPDGRAGERIAETLLEMIRSGHSERASTHSIESR